MPERHRDLWGVGPSKTQHPHQLHEEKLSMLSTMMHLFIVPIKHLCVGVNYFSLCPRIQFTCNALVDHLDLTII